MLNSIQNLIRNLSSIGVKIYCITGMKFSFHLKAKEHFVHKYYGTDIEVISTRPQELKEDAIKILQKVNDCDLNEILFIDDFMKNIIRFNSIGTYTLLPNEVGSLLMQQ